MSKAPAPKRKPQPDAGEEGCAPSFLTQKQTGLDRSCEVDPLREEEYVQPDNEKEVGGEG